WLDEAFLTGISDYDMLSAESFREYSAGSRTAKVWGQQPLRPDWYDEPIASGSFCQPTPITRTHGVLSVRLVELVDQHQRYDCLDGAPGWDDTISRTLTLPRDGTQIGSANTSHGDFAVPSAAGTYTLTYDLRTQLPISSRVTTAWTFRSAGPNGTQ